MQHSQRFSDRLTGYLNLQGVSDDTYFTDLSTNIAATSQTNLPREGALTYNGDWWTLFGRLQKFQTLQDPDSPPVTPPYARVPQLALRAAQHNVRGFDLDFFGEVGQLPADRPGQRLASGLLPLGQLPVPQPAVLGHAQAWIQLDVATASPMTPNRTRREPCPSSASTAA